MLDLLIKEFKTAPQWQKILLILLLGVLSFHFFIYTGFVAFEKKIESQEIKRDLLFRQLQSEHYILEDAKVISANYKKTTAQLTDKLSAKSELELTLKQLIKKYSRKVIEYQYINPEKIDYGEFIQETIQLKLSRPDFIVLFRAISELPFVNIKKAEYVTEVLTLRLEFLTKKGLSNSRKTVIFPKQNPARTEQTLAIQGFYAKGNLTKVIINNKVYNTGDKVGRFSILGIYPEHKSIKIKDKNNIKVIYK